MRIDLSREDETRMLPSNSVESDSMNAFQKELVERIGYRVQHNNYESFKEFFELIFNNLDTVHSHEKFFTDIFFRKTRN